MPSKVKMLEGLKLKGGRKGARQIYALRGSFL